MNKQKKNIGITLIALIITIIVLLILAGVTINMVLGENGLFNKAKTSVAKYENAQKMENSIFAGYETEIDNTRDNVQVLSTDIKALQDAVSNLQATHPNMISPPIGLLTATLQNSQTNTRAKGSYYAKSDSFTKSLSTIGNNYLEFVTDQGWRVKKSGMYMIDSSHSHNTSTTKQSGSIETSLIINGQHERLTLDWSDGQEYVAQDFGSKTVFLKAGDIIDYRYYLESDGFWNYAIFNVKALFE